LLDLLNKQNVETRRTGSFLRFALGERSPEKKNYFKSKFFVTPEEARLKGIGEADSAVNKTVYNVSRVDKNLSLINDTSETRAKTSKGQDPRSMSMDMKAGKDSESYKPYGVVSKKENANMKSN
jgi:hypothetical protein